VVTIAVTNLPAPALVSRVDETVVRHSSVPGIPRHHRPDPTLHPGRARVLWQGCSGAIGDAIRRHYDEHPNAVWSWTVPRTGEVVRALWAAPPNIQWASATTVASITAEVEIVLAHE
jgi:hypothetical protein